jgi:hypothetical protein
MFRWTVLLLIAALAGPVGEVAAVACDPAVMQAMPCCAQGMENCGMAGMTADCCILVPGEDLPPATSTVSLDSGSICRNHLALQVAVVVPVPAPELAPTQTREAASARAPDYAAPFFVRTSVLRI